VAGRCGITAKFVFRLTLFANNVLARDDRHPAD
jgi:hypothetical protein